MKSLTWRNLESWFLNPPLIPLSEGPYEYYEDYPPPPYFQEEPPYEEPEGSEGYEESPEGWSEWGYEGPGEGPPEGEGSDYWGPPPEEEPPQDSCPLTSGRRESPPKRKPWVLPSFLEASPLGQEARRQGLSPWEH